MIEALENTLRIKVTGKCNRGCAFCHREGGMEGIEEVYFSEKLQKAITTLNREFGISTVAFTGGEPLLFPGLTELASKIADSTPVSRFSLTTNGTIVKDKSFWETFTKIGLYKVNVSIPDILDNALAEGDLHTGEAVFKAQIGTVKTLCELGISVNINVVVYNDGKCLENVLSSLFKTDLDWRKVKIALLPNLNSKREFDRSFLYISEALKRLKVHKIKMSVRKGTSNAVCEFESSIGDHIQVKSTKANGIPKWLNSLCGQCERKDDCQEGFYGLRLEVRNGEPLIRTCLYKSTDEVLMPLEKFLVSPVFRELKELWC